MKSGDEISGEHPELECSGCGKMHDISQFISLVNGSQTSTCLTCRFAHMEYRKTTPRKIAYDACRERMEKCVLCGDCNKDHLEFDHVDRATKTGVISSIEDPVKLIQEVLTCRVLCKKCHRKITQDEKHFESVKIVRKRSTLKITKYRSINRQRNRDYIRAIKLHIGKCMNPCCADVFDKENLTFYEFDHIDPFTKSYGICELVINACSIELINTELFKCQLLCG
jgi:hypothetical protein